MKEREHDIEWDTTDFRSDASEEDDSDVDRSESKSTESDSEEMENSCRREPLLPGG